MKHIAYFCLFLFFFSCHQRQEPDYLEQALVIAGENRPELEKVLQHYASNPDDSLKYKAAVFLIENMPGHYSYKNEPYLDQYYDAIADTVKCSLFPQVPIIPTNSTCRTRKWLKYFGESVAIGKISYTPRGDGNDITPGDTHELLYWDNGWVSLGKRKATDIKMVYENAPAHTIYWIRNLLRGEQERIFTYENGQQVWW